MCVVGYLGAQATDCGRRKLHRCEHNVCEKDREELTVSCKWEHGAQGVGLEVSLRFGAVSFPYLAGTYPKGPT